jgi:hypothetical protein
LLALVACAAGLSPGGATRAGAPPSISYFLGVPASPTPSAPAHPFFVSMTTGPRIVSTTVARDPLAVSPDELVTANGERLYTLEGVPSGGRLRQVLTERKISSWATLASRRVSDRMLYPIHGAGTMVLGPDGKTLFVYNASVTGRVERDWLTALDARTLATKKARIGLNGCGGAELAMVFSQIVVACDLGADVRFISPATDRVTARIPLTAGSTPVAVVGIGTAVYVVTNDLVIIQIDAVTHRVARVVTSDQQPAGSVSPIASVALTQDGRSLIVGVMGHARDTSGPFALHVFYTPMLTLQSVVSLDHFVHIAPAPGFDLYTFQMGDAPTTSWSIVQLAPDLTTQVAELTVPGPIFHVSTPGLTANGNA